MSERRKREKEEEGQAQEERRAQCSTVHPSMLRSEVCAGLTISVCSYPRCQHMERIGTCSSWMIRHLSVSTARA